VVSLVNSLKLTLHAILNSSKLVSNSLGTHRSFPQVSVLKKSECLIQQTGCLSYFRQPQNGNQCVLSGYATSCVSFIHGFSTITPLFSITLILARVVGEQRGYATEITNEKNMRASVIR
jgi:hypothetical protein